VTTGAGNDIERATALARRMVTQFGMSEAIGLMAVGEREQEVFLGRDFGSRREVSESTSKMVDTEVKRLIDEAYATALRLLHEHRPLLDRIAVALLERETIDREDLDLLARNLPLPPRSVPPPAAPVPAEKPRSETSAGVRPPLLGAPPAEPAGA
jgi:cell division protease FtsH